MQIITSAKSYVALNKHVTFHVLFGIDTKSAQQQITSMYCSYFTHLACIAFYNALTPTYLLREGVA